MTVENFLSSSFLEAKMNFSMSCVQILNQWKKENLRPEKAERPRLSSCLKSEKNSDSEKSQKNIKVENIFENNGKNDFPTGNSIHLDWLHRNASENTNQRKNEVDLFQERKTNSLIEKLKFDTNRLRESSSEKFIETINSKKEAILPHLLEESMNKNPSKDFTESDKKSKENEKLLEIIKSTNKVI